MLLDHLKVPLKPSRNSSPVLVWLLAVYLFNSTTLAQNQALPTTPSPDRDRGVQLYEQGDAAGAIAALRHAIEINDKDGTAWHYLGLAYLLKDSKDDARRSFWRAVTIRESSLPGSLMVTTSAEDPASARQKRSERFAAAAESLEKYLELSKTTDPSLVEELDSLKWYRDYFNGTLRDEEIITTKEATRRLRIVEKPPPHFSGTRGEGTGSLRAVFSADGTVKHIIVTRKIDPEFDRACILAAKQIQFEPAIKDGRPVSMILQVEYSRTLY